MLTSSTKLIERLEANTRYFREKIRETGLNVLDGVHPITPIMLGDASLAQEMAQRLLKEGVYVIGFSYPVVPKGQARIRVQISAAHTRENIDFAIEKFSLVGRESGFAKRNAGKHKS